MSLMDFSNRGTVTIPVLSASSLRGKVKKSESKPSGWFRRINGFLPDSYQRKIRENERARAEKERRLLEAELAKLGVPVGDFVARLEASPQSRAASDLIETVLAMDDFVSFKAMMIRLKEDVEDVVDEEDMARFSRGNRAL